MDLSGYNIISEQLVNTYVIQEAKDVANNHREKEFSSKDSGEKRNDEEGETSTASGETSLKDKNKRIEIVKNKEIEQELFYNDPDSISKIMFSAYSADNAETKDNDSKDDNDYGKDTELTDSNIDNKIYESANCTISDVWNNNENPVCGDPTKPMTLKGKVLLYNDVLISSEQPNFIKVKENSKLSTIYFKPLSSSGELKLINTKSEENGVEDKEFENTKKKKNENINGFCAAESTFKNGCSVKSFSLMKSRSIKLSTKEKGSRNNDKSKSLDIEIAKIDKSINFKTPITPFCQCTKDMSKMMIDENNEMNPVEQIEETVETNTDSIEIEALSPNLSSSTSESASCTQNETNTYYHNEQNNDQDKYGLVRSRKTANMFSSGSYCDDQDKVLTTSAPPINDSTPPPMIFVLSDYIMETQEDMIDPRIEEDGYLTDSPYELGVDKFSVFDLPPLFIVPDLLILPESVINESSATNQVNTRVLPNDFYDSDSSDYSIDYSSNKAVEDEQWYSTEDEKEEMERSNLYQTSIFDKIDLLAKNEEREKACKENEDLLSEVLLEDIMKELQEY